MDRNMRAVVASMTAATNGKLYDANFDQIVLDALRACKRLCHAYNQLCPGDPELNDLLREIVGTVGEHATIQPPFWCDYGLNIHLGEGFYANHGLTILDGGMVSFGENVFIAPNCVFSTAGHPIDAERRNQGLEYALPITVGDNVWFGMGVLVCPGVTIGSNVVIGAGSVVTKDIPDGVVAVGNPCRVLREITPEDAERTQF